MNRAVNAVGSLHLRVGGHRGDHYEDVARQQVDGKDVAAPRADHVEVRECGHRAEETRTRYQQSGRDLFGILRGFLWGGKRRRRAASDRGSCRRAAANGAAAGMQMRFK